MRAWWGVLMLATLGCRSAERAALRVDPALAALVSSDAVFVAGARLEALRATPFYRKWVAGRPQPWLDRLAERTGLDPRKDLWELLIASDGKQTLALARGKFAPQGLEPRLEGLSARRTPYKGYTLIGEERAALVFMNSTTAAAGPAPSLRALIDRRNRSRGASPLLAKTKEFPAGTQLWMVSAGGAALAEWLPSAGNLANLGKIFSMLESSSAAADLRSGLRLSATGVCRNNDDARTLAEALRGLIGLARLSTPDETPELLRAYDGIGVEQDQRSVRIRAEIAQDLLEKLFERWSRSGLPGAAARLPQPRAPQPRSGGK